MRLPSASSSSDAASSLQESSLSVSPAIPLRVYVRVRPLTSYERNRRSRRVVDCRPECRTVTLDDDNDTTHDTEERNDAVILPTERDSATTSASSSPCYTGVWDDDATQDDVCRQLVGDTANGDGNSSSSSNSNIPQQLLDGHHCTVIAYGGSGTGKTHTLLGPNQQPAHLAQSQQQQSLDADNDNGDGDDDDSDSLGLTPRLITQIFERLASSTSTSTLCGPPSPLEDEKGDPNDDTIPPLQQQQQRIEYTVRLSVVEVYLDQWRDLLAPNTVPTDSLPSVVGLQPAVMDLTTTSGSSTTSVVGCGVDLVGCTMVSCINAADTIQIIQRATARRRQQRLTESTTSSSGQCQHLHAQRSTCVIQLQVEQTLRLATDGLPNVEAATDATSCGTGMIRRTSRLHIIDLASSSFLPEQASATATTTATPKVSGPLAMFHSQVRALVKLHQQAALSSSFLASEPWSSPDEERSTGNNSQHSRDHLFGNSSSSNNGTTTGSSRLLNHSASILLQPDPTWPAVTRLLLSALTGVCRAYTTIVLHVSPSHLATLETRRTLQVGQDLCLLAAAAAASATNTTSAAPSACACRDNIALSPLPPLPHYCSIPRHDVPWHDPLTTSHTWEAHRLRHDRLERLVYALAQECQHLRDRKPWDRHLWPVIEAVMATTNTNTTTATSTSASASSQLVMDNATDASSHSRTIPISTTPSTTMYRKLDFTIETKEDHEAKLERMRQYAKHKKCVAERDQAVLERDQVRSELAVAHAHATTLSEQQAKLVHELTVVKREHAAQQQRMRQVEHYLRTSQFRESEAVVFLRQLRRFYYRLLKKTATEGNGEYRDIGRSVPGAPDLHQLVDIDHFMMQSGLLEERDIGGDVSLDCRPSPEAMRRSMVEAEAAHASAILDEQEQAAAKAAAAAVEQTMEAAESTSETGTPAASLEQTMEAAQSTAETGALDESQPIESAAVEALDEAEPSTASDTLDENPTTVSVTAQPETEVVESQQAESSTVPVAELADEPASPRQIPSILTMPKSIVARAETADEVQARQMVYQTPAGKCVTLREKMLEEELLQLSEINSQLRLRLEEERTNVEALTDKIGAVGAFDKMRAAQETRLLKEKLKRKDNDLNAVIWKMNELHMVGKTLMSESKSREQHVGYLEESLLSTQNQQGLELNERQSEEKRFRDEIHGLRQQVDTLTIPAWQVAETALQSIPLSCRIVVPCSTPIESKDVFLENVDDNASTHEVGEWMDYDFYPSGMSQCEAATQTDSSMATAVPMSTQTDPIHLVDRTQMTSIAVQTEDDDYFLHMSQGITADTLGDYMFMDSPGAMLNRKSPSSKPQASRSFDGLLSNSPAGIYPTYPTFDSATDAGTLTNGAMPAAPFEFADTTTMKLPDKISSIEAATRGISSTSDSATMAANHPFDSTPSTSSHNMATSTQTSIGDSTGDKVLIPNTSYDETSMTISQTELDGEKSHQGLDVCAATSPTTIAQTLGEKLSPNRLPRSGRKPVPATKSADSVLSGTGETKPQLSSFLSRLQKQSERKVVAAAAAAADDDDKSTTPEFMKLFKKIGGRNQNEAVLETSGAGQARDATRTAFGIIKQGSLNTAGASNGAAAAATPFKKWTPKAKKKSDDGSDSDDDSFAASFMRGAQMGRGAPKPALGDDSEGDERETEILAGTKDEDTKDKEASNDEEKSTAVPRDNDSSNSSNAGGKAATVSEVAPSHATGSAVAGRRKDDSDSDSSDDEAKATAKPVNKPTPPAAPPAAAANRFAKKDDSDSDSSDDEAKVPPKPVAKPVTPPAPPAAATTRSSRKDDSDSDSSDDDDDKRRPPPKPVTAAPTLPVPTPASPPVATKPPPPKRRNSDSDSDSDSSEDRKARSRPAAAPPKPATMPVSTSTTTDSNDKKDDEVPKPAAAPAKAVAPTPSRFARKNDSDSDSSDSSEDHRKARAKSAAAATASAAPAATVKPAATARVIAKKQDSDSDSSDDDSPKPRPKAAVAAVVPTKPAATMPITKRKDDSSGSDSSDDEAAAAARAKKISPAPRSLPTSRPLDDSDDSDDSDSDDARKRAKPPPTPVAAKPPPPAAARLKKADDSSDEDSDDDDDDGDMIKRSKRGGGDDLQFAGGKAADATPKTQVPDVASKMTSGLSPKGKSKKDPRKESKVVRSPSKSSSPDSKTAAKFVVRDGKLVKSSDVAAASADPSSPSRSPSRSSSKSKSSSDKAKPAFTIVDGKLVKSKSSKGEAAADDPEKTPRKGSSSSSKKSSKDKDKEKKKKKEAL